MLDYHIYDVFTDTAFAGNPLAIVEGADALSVAQMQTIARQFSLSETIFVQTPEDPAHSAKVRIFTPTAEIPFAGHPTIGCALFLAGSDAREITLEEQSGLVPVTISRDGPSALAEFTAPRLPHPIGTAPTQAQIATAVGLAEADLGPHAPGGFEGGPAFLYAQVRNPTALARAKPVEPGWSAMRIAAAIDDTGRSPLGLYLYTAGEGADLQARMFAPDDGILEDPATGSATAILAGQLLANGALGEGATVLQIRQGVEMGRPSTLQLTADVIQGALARIRVAGHAVPVAKGQIRVPD